MRCWINGVLEGIQKELSEETQEKILAYCGKACAHNENLKILKKLKSHVYTLDELIHRMNKEIPWCGKWIRENNRFRSICTSCGCPLVRDGIVNNSSLFCKCSKGWVKTIFEEITGYPVKVNLKRSIGFGDSVCEFDVEI